MKLKEPVVNYVGIFPLPTDVILRRLSCAINVVSRKRVLSCIFYRRVSLKITKYQ